MINEVLDVLVEMHLSPQKQSPSMITFSRDERNFVFFADMKNDPSYYRLMLPDIEPNMDDPHLLDKMVDISSRFKSGKCVRAWDRIALTVEAFSYDKNSLPGLITRWIDLLMEMLNAYREYGNESVTE